VPPAITRREALQWAACAALAGCTRAVSRPEIQTRYYSVDWAALDAPVLTVGGLNVRSVILSPTQWPLEGSVKRLLTGDFVGVLDALKITFTPSQLPSGVLRDLYDAGFVPAYLRVENPAPEARGFFPERLALDIGGDPLTPVPPDTLPPAFREMDWERTALSVAFVALIVLLIAERRSGGLMPGYNVTTGRPGIYVGGSVRSEEGPSRYGAVDITGEIGSGQTPGAPGARPRHDPGVLRAEVLGPGEAREGLVFFYHKGRMVDWSRARLAAG
jgi:hypothetical protein